MGHYAADMRPDWFEQDKKKKRKSEKEKAKTIREAKHLDATPELGAYAELPVSISLIDQEIEALNAAVDSFALRMKTRLAQKAKEGFSGWETTSPHVMRNLLLNSTLKESTLDLGIYAMMLAHRGISMKQGERNEG